MGSLFIVTDRFDAARIARMVGHYCRILQAVSAQPDLRLSDVPLLTDEERQQLLVEWNQTATEYPNEQRIHELFEQQAQKQPNAIALCSVAKEPPPTASSTGVPTSSPLISGAWCGRGNACRHLHGALAGDDLRDPCGIEGWRCLRAA